MTIGDHDPMHGNNDTMTGPEIEHATRYVHPFKVREALAEYIAERCLDASDESIDNVEQLRELIVSNARLPKYKLARLHGAAEALAGRTK